MDLDAITSYGRWRIHLARVGSERSLCGRSAPWWFRSKWQGDRDLVCKRCLKVIDVWRSLAEENNENE